MSADTSMLLDGSLYGPRYPDLGARVARLRRNRAPEHGAAVLEAINRLNLAALKRAEEPLPPCPCASGTRFNTGKKILAAVNASNLAKLHARPFPDPISKRLTK